MPPMSISASFLYTDFINNCGFPGPPIDTAWIGQKCNDARATAKRGRECSPAQSPFAQSRYALCSLFECGRLVDCSVLSLFIGQAIQTVLADEEHTFTLDEDALASVLQGIRTSGGQQGPPRGSRLH